MKLHKKPKDEYEIDGIKYKTNASFDTILKILKMINDGRVHPVARPGIGLKLLIDESVDKFEVDGKVRHLTVSDLFETYEADQLVNIFKDITEMYIEFEKPPLDRQGNPVPQPKQENDKVLDYEQDAEYIFASFMQAYGIDLIEAQGQLHWSKFKALLNGLPKDTKVVEVVSIRNWKPADDKAKRSTAMRKLQKVYQLKGEEE